MPALSQPLPDPVAVPSSRPRGHAWQRAHFLDTAPLAIAPIVKARSRRKKPIKPRPTDPRDTTAKQLAWLYLQVVRFWNEYARNTIMPTYRAALPPAAPHEVRDDARNLGSNIGHASEQANHLIVSLTPDIRSWTVKAESIHRSQFTSSLHAATNVSMGTQLTAGQVAPTLGDVFRANVDLIKNVSDETKGRIEKIVFQGYTSLTPPTEIAKQINEAVGLGKARSLRIASDQNTKLSGLLDQERQAQLGIEQFIWIHSGKVHFRPEHKERDGMLFRWDDPEISDDLPGWAINCGCKAQAYIDLEGVEPATSEPVPVEEVPVFVEPPYDLPETFPPPIEIGNFGQRIATEPAFQVEPPPQPLPPPMPPPPVVHGFADHEVADYLGEERKKIVDGMGLELKRSRDHRPLDYYTGSGYSRLNGALRDAARHGTKISEDTAATIRSLDTIFADTKPTIADGYTWRGVNSQRNYQVGDIITEPGYTSTSIKPSVAKNFGGGTLYRYRVPKGTKTFLAARQGYADVVGALSDEAEVILDRGTSFRVVRRTERKYGGVYLEVEIVPPS